MKISNKVHNMCMDLKEELMKGRPITNFDYMQELVIKLAKILVKVNPEYKMTVLNYHIKLCYTDTVNLASYEKKYKSIYVNEEFFNTYKNDQKACILIHEMVHAAQDLVGCKFDFTKEYNERTHEIEAYTLSELITGSHS